MSSPASETKDSVEIELLKQESKAKFEHEVLRHPYFTTQDISILNDDFSASFPYYIRRSVTYAAQGAFVLCQPYLLQTKTNGVSEWDCGEMIDPFIVTDQGFMDIDQVCVPVPSLEELIEELCKLPLRLHPRDPNSELRYSAKNLELITKGKTIRQFQEDCDAMDKITETCSMNHRGQYCHKGFLSFYNLPRFKSKEQETQKLPYDIFTRYYGFAVDYIKCLEAQRRPTR